MCCTYVLVKEVVLQEIVWGKKKLPIKDVSLGAFIGVFLHFFFQK